MKESILSIVFIISIQLSFCQLNDKVDVLNKIYSYCKNQNHFTLEVIELNKNYLTEGFDSIIYKIHIEKNTSRFAKINVHLVGKSLLWYFKNDSTYYVYSENKKYLGSNREDDNSDEKLDFLPFWNPDKFFLQLFNELKNKAKNKLQIETNGLININTSNGESVFFYYDTIKFNIYKYELFRQIKQGTKHIKYTFSELKSSDSVGLIEDELNLIKSNYSPYNLQLSIENTNNINIEKLRFEKSVDLKLLNNSLQSSNVSTFQSEYLLIDFFYQTCYPCIIAFPEIIELRNNLDNSKLSIIGIDPMKNEDNKEWDKFKKRYTINYPILVGNNARAIRELITEKIHHGYPLLVLLDAKGKIVLIQEGNRSAFFRKLKKIVH